MPQPNLAIGNDFFVTFNGITKNIGSFKIKSTSGTTDFNVLDTLRQLRRITSQDCTITVTGMESGAAGAGTFAKLQQAQLTQSPLQDLGWDDKSITPASMLPAIFFTIFPLSEWRITDVESGPGGTRDATSWTVTLTSGHAA